MKVSVCITVLNEETSIKSLLDSLFSQSFKPSEIVIVDGGSNDKTIKIIKTYPKIKLLIKKNLSIAKGRNLAIKNASNKIIAMTDAGCICDKNWLKYLTGPFKNKNTQVVAGFYTMTGSSSFQKAIKPFLGIMPQEFNEYNFLPSTRSVAFTRALWKKVGGFCENFDRAGEDTDFNQKLIFKNIHIVSVKNAIVKWEIPKSIWGSFKKFFYYSRGDAQSGKLTTSHNIHTLKIFARYFVFLLLLLFSFVSPLFLPLLFLIFFTYLFFSIYKTRHFVKEWKARAFVLIIQLVSDFAVMAGFIAGIWATQNKY